MASSNTSWSPELVSALHRPSLGELLRAALRGYLPWRGRPLDQAILLAATACQRCKGALAHRHGLTWGYRDGSREWFAVPSSCELCEGRSV